MNRARLSLAGGLSFVAAAVIFAVVTALDDRPAPAVTRCPSPADRTAAGRALALARLREARGLLDRIDGADALAVDAILAEAIGELDDATPPTEPTTP